MTFTATPPRLALPNEKPAPNSERVMVGNDVLLSVLYAVGNGGCERTARLGLLPGGILSNCLGAIPEAAVSHALGAASAEVELEKSIGSPSPLNTSFAEACLERVGGASTLGTVSLGNFGAKGGWNGAEGLSCFVFSGHGLVWLVGALSPADAKTVTQRRVIARESLNYFHRPKSGAFSPLNAEPIHGEKDA